MPGETQHDELVMSLVERALARPLESREACLRSACAGDAQLFEEAWAYVQWEQRMNGFLLDPLCRVPVNQRPIEPGELLGGRFRIVREVAEGGMGIVFEAKDEKLDRRIALKCAKTGFHKRLPPEVRHASEISHPNVCKIFEIHTASTRDGEIDFLTMEFLEGETLAERIRRGVLTEKEARVIAGQLCAGLAEAHRNHVIHGDLKSNNVILTTASDGSTRAVITDFGLARKPETTAWAGQSGMDAGTPDYMAPELLRGAKASVASDIYALGVILHELAAGRRPYAPDVPAEQRVLKNPAPPKWDRILTRCLDPDPARRYPSVNEIAQALAPSHFWRWVAAAAAVAVLAVVSSVASYRGGAAPREAVRLAMLPLRSDPSTTALAASMSRNVSNELAHLTGGDRAKLTTIPLSKALRDKVDSADGARSVLGATHVLQGTLTEENGKVVLHAYLTDARSTKEWIAEYRLEEARYVPVALAGFVTNTLRLPPYAVNATVNAAAKQDYIAGLAYSRRNSTAEKALGPLERAVTADPDSPLTHAALAEAEWLQYKLTKDAPLLKRAAESARQAGNRNPDLAQVHRVAGLLQAEDGRYDQAETEYIRAIELDPKNGDAHRRLAQAYEANDQLDEALSEYRKAVEVEPGELWNPQGLGAFYYHRARYAEALAEFQKMVALGPDISESHRVLAGTYTNLGRFAEAEKELRIAIGLEDTSKAEHDLGYLLMQEGRDKDAIVCYERALVLGPKTALHWLNLGVSYFRIGNRTAARSAFESGRTLAEKEVEGDPQNGRARSELAYLSARLGQDPERAASDAQQAVRFWPDDQDTRWMAVVTYEALGQGKPGHYRDVVFSMLGSVPPTMLPALLAELSRYPDVAGLTKDSRFLRLLAVYHVQ
jgi:tetratricopeptide (TPR) repeat protein